MTSLSWSGKLFVVHPFAWHASRLCVMRRTIVRSKPVVARDDPKTIVESNVVLSIFAADISVRLDKKMVAELNRSTKKNPPTRMKYELIYVRDYGTNSCRLHLTVVSDREERVRC